MNELNHNTNSWKSRANQGVTQLAIWTGAWVMTMALAAFGPDFLWGPNRALTVAAILFNLVIGIGMIVANIRHIQKLDELMQKIQLEAMAIALGVGIVGGLSLSLLDTENVIPVDAEISYMVILISVTYLISCFIVNRRYR